MRNVGLYVRVSTKEQAEKGWSIEGQLADLHRYCDAQKDWKVRWILKDPGYTAANLDRPGVQRLLELVQEGRMDVIVVWRYDRLSRDNLDFPLLLHLFRKHNVDIVSATEPAPGTDTPYGEFVVGMIGLIATLERKMNAVRVKMGMRTRTKKGFWHGGPVPYGYAYFRETGRLAPIPAEAEVVRRIFEVYADLGRLHALKERLRTEGRRDRRGRPWNVQTLRLVLRRRRYAGVVVSGGVDMEDTALALVGRDLFDRCQTVLDEERRRNEDVEPREGIVCVHLDKEGRPACPRCGSRQGVRKKGVRLMAGGTVQRRYFCRLCRAEFRDLTAALDVPPCPGCRRREKVQYFRERTSPDGIRFRLFGCKACRNRFRVLVRDPLGGPAVAAVGTGAGELAAAPAAPLPVGDP